MHRRRQQQQHARGRRERDGKRQVVPVSLGAAARRAKVGDSAMGALELGGRADDAKMICGGPSFGCYCLRTLSSCAANKFTAGTLSRPGCRTGIRQATVGRRHARPKIAIGNDDRLREERCVGGGAGLIHRRLMLMHCLCSLEDLTRAKLRTTFEAHARC